MLRLVSLLILIQFILSNVSFAYDKKLLYKDATYEEEIRTVQLFPDSGHPQDAFLPPIAPINQNNLVLEFDDLVEDHEDYRVKIIHCNAEWSKSRLNNLEFLYDFNEFNITNFRYSVDTKISYVHYEFKIPRVKLPGNYLLVAFRADDDKDIILTKRFMLYSKSVNVFLTSNLTGVTSIKRANQQLDFQVSYSNYEIINPIENVKIVIRQNQRWDNMVTELRPSFIREAASQLDYQFFNFENNFKAGNEYRFFDLRSLRFPGQNVQRANLRKRPSEAYVMTDKSRAVEAYAQYDDINGNFIIQNTDTGDGVVQSDYLYIDFSIACPKVEGQVYVVGKMNNYDLSHRLNYDQSTERYSGRVLLKQGFYSYQYYVKGDNLSYNYLEGDHYETENEYEILVYYRAPNRPTDLLIGYSNVTLNPRNN